MTWIRLSARYDGVVISFAISPKAIAVEVMNSKCMLSTREQAIKYTTGDVSVNVRDIDLAVQRCSA